LTFTLDSNHSRENVRAYNIYWFTSSSIYDAFDLEDILEALWNGEIVYGSESIDINSDPKLEKYEHFIATTSSSFILMMRKDLWDVHIDADKQIINIQGKQNQSDKG